MTSTNAINRANLKESVGFRDVVPPKPEVLAACRNCAFYACDHDDRQGKRDIIFVKSNHRCQTHRFPVKRNTVCDHHQFKHNDRRDA